MKNAEATAKAFMAIAAAEFFLFLGFMYAEGNENFRLMCISGLILGGGTAAALAASTLCSFAKESFSERRAALRALGKHGLRILRHDEGARCAYKGILMLMKGRYPEAEEKLMRALSISDNRKAAEIAPDNPDAQSRLGHAYYNEGKLSSAEYCFEQALRYDPNYGYSYYSLATIYTLRGEDERALETLKKLVTIQENHPLVYAELATWYAMHDDEKNAEEAYDKAILCGYKDPEELSKRMFNHAENATGNDLPRDYYRYIEKEETEETVKEDTDAGNV